MAKKQNYSTVKVSGKGIPADAFKAVRGLGGSDMGKLTGKSKYAGPLTLHRELVGEYPPEDVDNRFTREGHRNEPYIAHMLQYWDFEDEDTQDFSVYLNEDKNKKFCTVKATPYMYVSHHHPTLTANPDRFVYKHKKFKGRGVLECKNRNSMVLNDYKYGFLPMDYLQAQFYCGITESDYVILGYYVDGNRLMYHHFPFDRELYHDILQVALKFLKNVDKAIEIKEKHGLRTYLRASDVPDKLAHLVPKLRALEPDFEEVDLPRLKEFVKDVVEDEEVQGNYELEDVAKEYLDITDEMKVFDAEKSRLQAIMIDKLLDGGGNKMMLPSGYYSYKKNRFYIQKKINAKEEEEA